MTEQVQFDDTVDLDFWPVDQGPRLGQTVGDIVEIYDVRFPPEYLAQTIAHNLYRSPHMQGAAVAHSMAYGGESEWLEIDSDEITYFLADHQDQFDTLEIMDE